MRVINDIEPIVSSTLLPYVPIVKAAFVVAAIVVFFVALKLLRLREKPKSQKSFGSLKIDRIDKEFLYAFTIEAKKSGCKEGLEELLIKIEPYKYKQESQPIDSVLKEEIQRYIKRCSK